MANHLPTVLRQWRKAKGWPAKRAAKEFGVTQATWSRWENGNRFPDHAIVQSLSNFLQIPICRLLCATVPDNCPWQTIQSRLAQTAVTATNRTGKNPSITTTCPHSLIEPPAPATE